MIPKILHLCWLSGDPYPDLINRCLESWSQHLPDYELRIWDSNSIGADFPAWVRQAASVRKYAFAADYIRLRALHDHGGIYLDADVEVLGRFERYLELTSFMGRETGGDLEPAIIGARPGAAWLKACLDYYVDRSFFRDDGSLETKPLPIVIVEMLKQRFGLDLSAPNAVGDFPALELTIFPADHFSPKNRFSNRIDTTRDTVAIHHFDGQWVDKGGLFAAKNTVHRILLAVLGQQNYVSVRNLLRRAR